MSRRRSVRTRSPVKTLQNGDTNGGHSDHPPKMQRPFPVIQMEHRSSLMDRTGGDKRADYSGFFVLFWIAMTILGLTTALRNLKDNGRVFDRRLWTLFTTDTKQIAYADAAMVASTVVALPIQRYIFRDGRLPWWSVGRHLQSIFEVFFILSWSMWSQRQSWSWTHEVYFVMHIVVMWMKLHSYSTYNGALSAVYHRLRHTPKDRPAEIEQLRTHLQSPFDQSQSYPHNLTWRNYLDYLLVPSLCYEISFPRTDKIRIDYIVEKVMATFGTLSLLVITTEHYILPVLERTEARLALAGLSRNEFWLELAEAISFLLFPFMLCILLVFYIIFEGILNVFAEVSRFADRNFYDEWWNCDNWEDFARCWNKPVHRFLYRHIYYTSRKEFSSKFLASLATFVLSALFHELIMLSITKKIRGYGFLCQMMQMPFIALQQVRWVRSQKLAGNILFWSSMIFGTSAICTFYVLV